MIPMAIHEVIGRIGVGLVEIRVAVRWRLYRTLDILRVHHLGLIR